MSKVTVALDWLRNCPKCGNRKHRVWYYGKGYRKYYCKCAYCGLTYIPEDNTLDKEFLKRKEK